MPEGDTLFRAAANARNHLLNQVITHCESTAPGVPAQTLLGLKMTHCRSVGKHLLMQFGEDLWLHTHLGMNGRWRFASGERKNLQISLGANRLLIHTLTHTAWCLDAPKMVLLNHFQLSRDPVLASLGPDILDPAVTSTLLVRAFRTARVDAPIGIALLDQRRCAGIGNVYKSEGLFLAGIDPRTAVSTLSDTDLEHLLGLIQKWMKRNVGEGKRGTRWPGRGQHWVYGRARQRCLKCDGTIARFMMGTPPRVTFICPICQSIT